MRSIQSRNGQAQWNEVDDLVIQPEHVLVKVVSSAVSVGTELMMIREGSNSDLGYSAAGVVVEVGEGVTHVEPGQRVACYGTSAHREYMLSPKHLTAPIPDRVTMEEAAFGGIGAIAVHAVRQAKLQFGETMVIVGLGILGQIIARIAHASNYRVIGVETMEDRRIILHQAGVKMDAICKDAEELKTALATYTKGLGADAVLVCASSRKESLLDEAIMALRDRGSVVIVGDTGCSFDRELLFGKEAELRISRAGGPGRYDRIYERGGVDYPIGYVRWTEGRNLEDYLRMVEEERIDIQSLISMHVRIDELPILYSKWLSGPHQNMGIVVHAIDSK